MIWFANETWPFGAALALMLALFVIEGAGLLLAQSPSSWLDGLFPESAVGLEGSLGWLHLGRVPFLILLGILLAGFSLSGYAIQSLSKAVFGTLLPAWLACVPALLAGFASVNGIGGLLARIMPTDETTAVSEESLIGRAGIVTQGIASRAIAAEVKVRDIHGRAHYVRVEPDLDADSFDEGCAVLLVKKQGAIYRAIRNPHPELL